MFGESKVFKYRYEFEPKRLLTFIKERYANGGGKWRDDDELIERVRLNGQSVHRQTLVSKGDWIEYTHYRSDEKEVRFEPVVLYEDEDIIAISKPDFLPVIPNSSYYYTSIAIYMKEKYHNKDLSPVHRLDIETSGVLLFGKSKQACSDIQKLFQEKRMDKRYQAIVYNQPTSTVIEGDLIPNEKSKIYTKLKLRTSDQPKSRTDILKSEPWGKYYRVWARPITGKTNQIRAHLAAINCPIVGDKKYYPDESVFLDWFTHRDISRIIHQLRLPRQALICESLTFTHPYSTQVVSIQDTTPAWREKIDQLLT